MKYAWIGSERRNFPVGLMCRVLEVSASGFYGFQARQRRRSPDRDARVREDLRTVYRLHRRVYGRRRLVGGLRALGYYINPKRVRRLMREAGIQGVRKGRFTPRTTDSAHARPVAANVLARRFAVDSGVPAWVGDISVPQQAA